MNANHLESKFAMMGARFKVSVAPAQRALNDYALDIQRDSHGEFFELRVPERLRDSLDVNVLQTNKRDRHLLLFVRPPEGRQPAFSAVTTSASGLSPRFPAEHRASCRRKRR